MSLVRFALLCRLMLMAIDAHFFRIACKGVLAGLFDDQYRFLSLGIVNKIDYQNRVLRIITPYKGKVDIVQFGQVKIDEWGREIGHTTANSV